VAGSNVAVAGKDPAALARLHGVLRFAAGGTAALVICEAMGWYPTFLAPLLAAVLLANLPSGLPFKVGVVLILVQAAGAYAAFILSSLMHGTPVILFGAISLILLLCFANLAQGRGFLPILLVLISFSTIPIVTMIAPQQAGALPLAFTRGMAVAVMVTWLVHAVWPKVASAVPPSPPTASAYPVAMALTGIAIVLPLMLVYLMYGITDALPVLITTVVLVINFDPKRSATQGLVMMIANFLGGMVALLAYVLLQVAPSLLTLTLITFLVALFFGVRVERGGPRGAVGLITFNQSMVLFSLALAPGGSSAGLWGTRLLQFGIACIFAVGMMSLLWPRLEAGSRVRGQSS
jgi:hypothetical protein